MGWEYIIAIIISLAASYALRPEPPSQKPAELGDLEVPSIRLGREIPVLFGTRDLKDPHLAWYGDLRTVRIKDDDVIVGYKYFLGAHLIWGHGPFDKVTRLYWDDRIAWEGESSGGTITVDAPTLFGKKKKEGGISGDVDLAMGGPTQVKSAYLDDILSREEDALTPAFRGVVSTYWHQLYVGNSPHIHKPSIRATRIQSTWDGSPQWYSAKAAIGQDMNPAHIIRECLTNPIWGDGYADADIDDTAFQAAADALHTEGMGISLTWAKSGGIWEFIKIVMRHIDGVLFVDQGTGLWTLTLARDDYDHGTLLHLDESNISKVAEYNERDADNVPNTFVATFWNSSTGEDDTVPMDDPGLVNLHGKTIPEKVSYPGFTNWNNAARACFRDLKVNTTPLISATIECQRAASTLRVGDVFMFSWSKYHVDSAIMRVVNIAFGTLTNNRIRIECVQDVFSITDAIYAPPPPEEWVPPSTDPLPIPTTQTMAQELPLWEILKEVDWLSYKAGESQGKGYAFASGVRPTSDSQEAELWSNAGSGYQQEDTTDFCPSCLLSAAITPNETAIPVDPDSWDDFDLVEVGKYAAIGAEFVRVDAVTDTEITVGRGVLDTVPAAHLLGERVYFVDGNTGRDQNVYEAGNTYYNTAKEKLITVTGRGELDLSLAPEIIVNIVGRLARPYPPGTFRLNAQAYPATPINGDQTITATWAHRDRSDDKQLRELIDAEHDSIGPEPGVIYIVEVRDELNNLVNTKTVLSGTSQALNFADMGYTSPVRIRLFARREDPDDDIDSFQTHSWDWLRIGWGFRYGEYYGGSV